MKLLILLLSAVCASTFAHPARVRLLSASENSAIIRVEDGSPEARIKNLVDSLHSAGITSFTFETTDDRVLKKLQPIWFDTGITHITIKGPEPPSSSTFPTLDPITARATLQEIDGELKRETTRFESHRKALVTFIYLHGIPEKDHTATLENLTLQKQQAQDQLATYLQSTPDDRLTLAAQIDLPGNPVAKHLKSFREARQEKAQLSRAGFGSKHPKIIATNQEVDATRQLAVDELSAFEEALHLKIYQLGKRAKHLEFWQQLSPSERSSRENDYEQVKTSYLKSLRLLRQLNATKKAALRSLKE